MVKMLTKEEEKVRDYLISFARKNEVVPYSKLAEHFGLDTKDKHQAWVKVLEKWMGDINNYELENKRPLLSAIIVFKKNPYDLYGTHKSGAGFYYYAREKELLKKGEDQELFHHAEMGRIFRYWKDN